MAAALTAAALAAFRDAAPRRAADHAAGVEPAYEAVRAAVDVPLPPWHALIATPPEERDDGWGPWLARVRACRMWQHGQFEPASEPELLAPDTAPETLAGDPFPPRRSAAAYGWCWPP